MKRPTTRTYTVSKTFNAPLEFVFDWCTDFREDDGKMTGSSAKRRFLERSKDRLVWLASYREDSKDKEGVRYVRLMPPDAWHLDTCGDGRELGDYKLTALGKNKTRLDMVFQVTYDDPDEVEDKETWEKDARESWDTYASYLEREYQASRSA